MATGDRLNGHIRPHGVDVARITFWFVVCAGALLAAFAVGLHAGVYRTALFRAVDATKTTIEDSLTIASGEAATLAGTHPTHFLQPTRNQGDGVTTNDAAGDQTDLILLSGFFEGGNQLRLIRRNGTIVARWPVKYYDVFPNPTHLPADFAPATNWNMDTHGALAMPDGSVVFNFEFAGLVRLDRCGRVEWSLPRRTHHSVERAEAGGFWVPSRRNIVDGPSPFPPFETPVKEDTVLRVGDDGRVLAEYSVPRLLYDNGLEPVVTATGDWFRAGERWDGEIVHLNKVEELTSDIAGDFPTFEAGDLALSLRDQNLVVVVDRTLSKVKWWRIGPWRRQHDPEFVRGGRILLFNNNVYETAFGNTPPVSPVAAPRVSHIGRIDPSSGAYDVIYGERAGQELLSVIRGKVEVTPAGGLMITEFEAGRVLETDANGKVVWEYVNRYNPTEVAEITEARVYPSSYFTVADWSCSGGGD